jgi:hypothetical protein
MQYENIPGDMKTAWMAPAHPCEASDLRGRFERLAYPGFRFFVRVETKVREFVAAANDRRFQPRRIMSEDAPGSWGVR